MDSPGNVLLEIPGPLDQPTLPYRLYTPTTAPTTSKLPLMIHLHGSGEAGTDNENRCSREPGTVRSTSPFPKTSSCKRRTYWPHRLPWRSTGVSTGIPEYNLDTTPETVSMTALIALLSQLLQVHPDIDPDRVYLVGLSRGWKGVWNAITK